MHFNNQPGIWNMINIFSSKYYATCNKKTESVYHSHDYNLANFDWKIGKVDKVCIVQLLIMEAVAWMEHILIHCNFGFSNICLPSNCWFRAIFKVWVAHPVPIYIIIFIRIWHNDFINITWIFEVSDSKHQIRFHQRVFKTWHPHRMFEGCYF